MIRTQHEAIRSITLPTRLEVRVLHDEELDMRRERFFEAVCRLIWDERCDETRKEQVLRRYARMRRQLGDGWFAETALQLADTYLATTKQFR